jgi:branched-chain amino acid transport system substrate-binding protein
MPVSRRPSLIALALPLALLVACERREGGTAGAGGTDTGPIRVGVFMDLSGQTSSFGQASVNGMKLAAAEINAAGGVLGRPLELVIEDDQGRPEQAATVVTKLVNQDKVVAILGEVASSNSLAAAPIAQQAAVPMITPSSTNPKVTQVGDYVFRVCFIDPFQGEAMARFAATTLGAKTAAILLDVNSDYSRGLTQFFTEAFTAAGGSIVDTQSYTQTDRDFSGQLTAVRAKQPDVIYIPGYYTQAGVIARQARQLGITQPLLGGDGWDAPQLFELGGDALEGAFLTNHYSVDDPSPVIQAFVEKFKATYGGTVPDAMAVLAYDATKVLADALGRAGSTAGPALRDAIAATRDFPGVAGNITINAERNADKPITVLEIKSGKFAFKESIDLRDADDGAAAPGTDAASSEPASTAVPATADTAPAATTNG